MISSWLGRVELGSWEKDELVGGKSFRPNVGWHGSRFVMCSVGRTSNWIDFVVGLMVGKGK
ncbi:unnamed protein product [Prunus brigantina]